MTTFIQLMKLQVHQLINWLNIMKKLTTLSHSCSYQIATNINMMYRLFITSYSRVTSNEEPVHHIQRSVLVPNNEESVTSVINKMYEKQTFC